MAIESDFMPDLEACFALILTAMATGVAPPGITGGPIVYTPTLDVVTLAITAFLLKYKAYQVYPPSPMPEVLPTMPIMIVDLLAV